MALLDGRHQALNALLSNAASVKEWQVKSQIGFDLTGGIGLNKLAPNKSAIRGNFGQSFVSRRFKA